MTHKIAFQGVEGAYSHLAVQQLFPDSKVQGYMTFLEALESVEEGFADYAVIPVENSTAGRVAGFHLLLPHTNLHVIGEHYLPIRHCLVAPKGAAIDKIEKVYSHEQALSQCNRTLHEMKLQPEQYADTAGAAKFVAEERNLAFAAISSEIAAEIYGLDVLKRDMQDTEGNTTRFLVLSRQEQLCDPKIPAKTTFLFRVRSLPAALYKALGGFATNGVNLTKLESYVEGESFENARFFAEIEGHVKDEAVVRAFEELEFFSDDIRILGCYPKVEI